MKRRLIIYSICLTIITVLAWIYKSIYPSMAVIYIPFLQISQWLVTLSQKSFLLNALAWLLFLFVSSLPLLIAILMYKKKLKRFDTIAMCIISLSLCIILYFSINMSLVKSWIDRIYDFGYHMDIRPMIRIGLFNIWLSLIAMYAIIKIFIQKHTSSKRIIYMMIVLLIFYMIIAIPNIMDANFTFRSSIETLNSIRIIVSIIFTIGMFVIFNYMIEFMTCLAEDIKHPKMLTYATMIKMTSLGMISLGAIFTLFENIYMLFIFDKTTHISFTFSLDIINWIIIIFFYGIYHYLIYSQKVIEEAELTI